MTLIVAVARLTAVAALAAALSACRTTAPRLPQMATNVESGLVVPLTQVADVHRKLRLVFDRYACVLAPSDRPIHIFAQQGVSDPQIRRAHAVLSWLLEDAPDTRFGADKSAVAEAMADAGATLFMFKDLEEANRARHNTLRGMRFNSQELYADECFVVGSPEWMDPETRDATVEEVFHLVHAYGIEPALPEFDDMIESAARAAIDAGVYTPPAEALSEWEAEGSVAHEYIISVIGVALGHWAHVDGSSFGGEYQVSHSEDLATQDPGGLAALRAFLPQRYVHEVLIEPSFGGTFRLAYDPALLYTLRSRLFHRVRLTGSRPAGITGSERDEVLTGNLGDNVLDGAGGLDVAVFQGFRREYACIRVEGGLMVADLVPGRDGADTLFNVELVRFADGERPIAEIEPPIPAPL